jgi:hypothetical protein
MANDTANHVAQALSGGDECPSIDDLVMRMDRELGDKLRGEAESHLAGCAHCQAELALFRDFSSSSARPEERADIDAIVKKLRKNSPAQRTSWWRTLIQTRVWMPTAAALAAAALVISFNIHKPRIAQTEISTDMGTFRSARVNTLAPLGDVTQVPAQLRWLPVHGATRYRVSVSEVDRTEVWNATVNGPAATLPPAVTRKIVPLKTLEWQVTALDSNGSALAESTLQKFRLAPSR